MKDLGNLVSHHEENTTATNLTLLVGLLSVAMAFLFSGEKEISFDKILFAISAIAALLGGIGCVLSYFKNRGGCVELYENGLLAEKGGKQYIALWDDIAVVKESIEKIYLKGTYLYDRYLYTIEKQNGETFDLSNMVSNIDQIGHIIKEKTLERLYPPAKEKINNGEQILFDSLSIDKNGLSGIPWAKLSSVEVKDGIIEVKDRDGKMVVQGSYAATPNAHLLIALLKEQLPLEP